MAKIDVRLMNAKYKMDLLTEEYAKLMTLPDEEFLSPEVTEKLNELRKKMVECIKEVNKPERTSKYFKKHYQVEEADLYEKQCGHCKKIFAIDYKWLEGFTMDCDPDWVRCTCPYCGKLLQWHI